MSAHKGAKLSAPHMGVLFEQLVGLELYRNIHLMKPRCQLHYWHDANSGIEVDFVLENQDHYLSIEVKWSEMPSNQDAKHWVTFLKEYQNAKQAFVVCRTSKAYRLAENITALPWQELVSVMDGLRE